MCHLLFNVKHMAKMCVDDKKNKEITKIRITLNSC